MLGLLSSSSSSFVGSSVLGLSFSLLFFNLSACAFLSGSSKIDFASSRSCELVDGSSIILLSSLSDFLAKSFCLSDLAFSLSFTSLSLTPAALSSFFASMSINMSLIVFMAPALSSSAPGKGAGSTSKKLFSNFPNFESSKNFLNLFTVSGSSRSPSSAPGTGTPSPSSSSATSPRLSSISFVISSTTLSVFSL